MADKSNRQDSRRAEVLEALVELYLRLNGYFCIRNYLQHRVSAFGLHTESDLLAMRMPNQGEVLENGRRQPNDPTLVLPEAEGMMDCVIVEVKEPSVEFNRPVRGPNGRALIAAAVRMFGVFPDNDVIEPIANELHAKINADVWNEYPETHDSEHRVSVRMLVFAPGSASHSRDRKHFDLQSVLDFTKWRMRPGEPCAEYRSPDVPSASPWRGCMRLIVETLDQSCSSNEAELALELFVERVIARWNIP